MFNSSEIYRDEMSESMNWKYIKILELYFVVSRFFRTFALKLKEKGL